ncbi:MAG: histidinol-phosphate transaminase [Gammaproteobacteria bacterium]|nr:histidinol-phosphate transaminase [Gammaproteobacteria bacterium]
MKINPNIEKLTPYQPGKPIDELARELGLKNIVKLASNENPYGPSPLAIEVLRAGFDELSRYPDGGAFNLKIELSRYLGIGAEQITVGNGSNDILDLAARCALTPGSETIVSQHAFVVYRLATLSAGGNLVEVPAKEYGADLGAMLDAVSGKTSIIFLANPNNPTGTWVNSADLSVFLDKLPKHIWVVLDEAYHEYVFHDSYPDGIKLLNQYPNLIITRTFSKIFGLAGLRVGYAVSSSEIADLMNRVRQPFNVNSLGMLAASAALKDEQFVASSKRLNQENMVRFCAGLKAIGVTYIPSAANFVAFDVGRPATDIQKLLLEEGFILRPIGEYGLPNHLRMTIGTEKENAAVLDILGSINNLGSNH